MFTVEVEDSYKLALESNTVVLNNGTVEAGGEYIMMLSRYQVGRFENYQPSSKNSIFRADDPEILTDMHFKEGLTAAEKPVSMI